MTLFLTSSPTGDLDGRYIPETGIDNRNGFLDDLRSCWRPFSRCLMITAFPDNTAASDEMTGFFRASCEKAGLSCSCFDLLDHRTEDTIPERLHSYDVIFLGGGHVPTQNRFFHSLGLREKLKDFSGIIIGISAGTMNCAETVYAMPEEAGEAADPGFHRFIPGLALTDVNILPHYQLTCNDVIDGLRLYEDIVIPDSMGHRFIAIPDGSYVKCSAGNTEIHGDRIIIENGVMSVS